jgi:hypothetical protein
MSVVRRAARNGGRGAMAVSGGGDFVKASAVIDVTPGPEFRRSLFRLVRAVALANCYARRRRNIQRQPVVD